MRERGESDREAETESERVRKGDRDILYAYTYVSARGCVYFFVCLVQNVEIVEAVFL